MKFKEYYETVCEKAGIKSIRAAAIKFGLGKSAIERIKAGDCDIPTDNMVNKIAAISGVTPEELYNQLEYLPIESRNFAMNKKIMSILHYRDRHFTNTYVDLAPTVTTIAETYLLNHFHGEEIDTRKYMAENGIKYPDPDGKYIPFVPPFIMSADDEIIVCEYLLHFGSGNTFMSTEDLFIFYLFEASMVPGISRYILIGTNHAEILYLKRRFEGRFPNYSFKVSLLAAHKDGSVDLYNL